MTNPMRRDTLDRRTVLKMTAVGATIPTLAGCSSNDDTDESDADVDDTAESGDSSDFDGWFDNVSNYDGVIDETGADEVTVAVGAAGNGGGLAFEPAAVRIDSGATVVWEWTGDGGTHNVVAEDGSFGSDISGEAGHTFERAFEESGAYRYACEPHERMGMKGAVVVE